MEIVHSLCGIKSELSRCAKICKYAGNLVEEIKNKKKQNREKVFFLHLIIFVNGNKIKRSLCQGLAEAQRTKGKLQTVLISFVTRCLFCD